MADEVLRSRASRRAKSVFFLIIVLLGYVYRQYTVFAGQFRWMPEIAGQGSSEQDLSELNSTSVRKNDAVLTVATEQLRLAPETAVQDSSEQDEPEQNTTSPRKNEGQLRLAPETAMQDPSEQDEPEQNTTSTRKNVAVLTVAIGDQSSISNANHHAYCSKWGYHCEVLNKSLDDRHPSWQKIPHTANCSIKATNMFFGSTETPFLPTALSLWNH